MTARPTLRFAVAVILAILPARAAAHDLPRQRVDRTVQLRFETARLTVDYTLELDDATIARDFRRLRNADDLPPDPDEWLESYGRLVAPLIAAALTLDGPDPQPDRKWEIAAIARRREVHTIYDFRFVFALNRPGRYRFRDTNFGTSEGISRLGVASATDVETKSDEAYPVSAAAEPYRPAWMLDDKELRKTVEWSGSVDWNEAEKPAAVVRPEVPVIASPANTPGQNRFWPMRFGFLSAALLGVLHTLQPGHGKTLLAAATLASGRNRGSRGWSIAVGWVVSHFAVIFVLAGLSLILPDAALTSVSVSAKKIAGFLIACPAAWRLGDRLRAMSIEKSGQDREPSRHEAKSNRQDGLLLGLTAGLIPCWEAIGLLLLGISAGHVLTGLALVGAFMAGSLCVVTGSMYAARAVSGILDPNRNSGRILMIGLDVVVLAMGATLLLASAGYQPFRS